MLRLVSVAFLAVVLVGCEKPPPNQPITGATSQPKDNHAGRQPTVKQTDKGRFQGRWVITGAELDGEKLDASEKGITWTFKGDAVIISSNRHEKEQFVLGPDKDPPTFDTISSRKETYLGIYKLNGDVLVLCVAGKGKERPTEFTSKNNQMVTTFKRQEEKAALEEKPGLPEKPVTDAEKKEFLKVLKKLPRQGEFFSMEAIKSAGPYLRVLLALTEKDLEEYDIYPFLALSRGLCEYERHRQYAVTHFDRIAHPTLRLFWGVILFNEEAASPAIGKFLKEALASKEQSKTLARMLGREFEQFKKEVEEPPNKDN